MKSVKNMTRCLGYFETTSKDEIYEICNYNITNTELDLEAMAI
ncbi:hypothetical protein [uncultured Maribacter sp.]